MGLRGWIRSLVGPSQTDQELEELRSRIDQLDDLLDSQEEALTHVLDVVTTHTERIDSLEDVDDRLEEMEQRLDDERTATEPIKPSSEASDMKAARKMLVSSGRSDGQTQRSMDAADRVAGIDEGQHLWTEATRAQQGIMKLMYDAGYPMSYREIAEELGRSVSTVKNHINNMKSQGVSFQEDTGHNNTKKYLLDERVKSFLTLRLND